MEQNPSGVTSASHSQKIPHILRCMKVQYHQVFSNPQGTRLTGQPKHRWWNCVKTDKNKGKIPNWKERSKNRAAWEKLIKEVKAHSGLYCHRRRRGRSSKEEEEEGSLLCLQEPATCPCLEPESKPTPFHSIYLRSFLILSSHLQLVFYVVFPSEF